jgi:hypothetical protein
MSINHIFLYHNMCTLTNDGAVMDVIVWELDLQLPVQSVPITNKVVISNPVHGEVYSIQVCQLTCNRSVVFSTNKTDGHDITEILLK